MLYHPYTILQQNPTKTVLLDMVELAFVAFLDFALASAPSEQLHHLALPGK